MPAFSCPTKVPNAVSSPSAPEPDLSASQRPAEAALPVEAKGKKAKKPKKDPMAPKGPLGAFMRFAALERPEVLGELGNLGVGEMGKELGRRWAVLGPADRQGLEAEATEDRRRYKEEMEAYQLAKQGVEPGEMNRGGENSKVAEEGKKSEENDEKEMDKKEGGAAGEDDIKADNGGNNDPKKVQPEKPEAFTDEKARSRKRGAAEGGSEEVAMAGPVTDYFTFLFCNWARVRQAIGRAESPRTVQEAVWRQWSPGPAGGRKVRRAAKRRPSAFLLFAARERAAVVSGGPGLSFAEVSAEVGRRWAALGPEGRGPFLALAGGELGAAAEGPGPGQGTRAEAVVGRPGLSEAGAYAYLSHHIQAGAEGAGPGYRCLLCPFSHRAARDVGRHLEEVHPELCRGYSCSSCGQRLRSCRALLLHLRGKASWLPAAGNCSA